MRAGNADLWSGLALAALAGYIIVQASGWEYKGPDGPGPGFFPLWYGIAMAVLSAALVASSVLRSEPKSVDWRGAGRAFAIWLALAVSVAAFKLVGFVIGFAALTFFVVAVMYRRPLHVAVAVAVALAAGFYVLFPLLLGVSLP
jgi:putative tricarboxylic transport membrane protein